MNFVFLRSIQNSLHSGFALMFCLSFFLKRRHFVMLHKRFIYQIEKQEETTLFLTGPKLPASFVSCNFIHYIFRKVFCNILIQKFQNSSTRTGCLALYISLFQNNYWRKKYFIFCFCDLCQTSTFQIISKHALSRSFLDRCVIL